LTMGPFKAAPLAVSMKPYRQASGDGLIVLILTDELKIARELHKQASAALKGMVQEARFRLFAGAERRYSESFVELKAFSLRNCRARCADSRTSFGSLSPPAISMISEPWNPLLCNSRKKCSQSISPSPGGR
jgi:hypothetical protein